MISRRNILKALGTLPAAGYLATSQVGWAETATKRLPQRLLGRTGRWVTPLALGGQASIQWTGPGIDAPDIIVRAVQLGVNYLDSANVYGPSQVNYGEAPAARRKCISSLVGQLTIHVLPHMPVTIHEVQNAPLSMRFL